MGHRDLTLRLRFVRLVPNERDQEDGIRRRVTETQRGDAPADENEMVEGGPWAGLVVLLTATALFFATFALIYFLSSTFRADPPSVGTSAPLSGTAAAPADTIAIPVLPGTPSSGPPPAGTIDIPVLSSKPTR
jgi:hypothetical protein